MKKYEMTSETKIVNGVTLYRIKALISFGDIHEGDIGGFIEKEENLSNEGNAWVYGNAKVRNKDYRTSLAFDALAKNIVEFKVGTTRFILDLPKLQEVMKEAGINEPMIVDNMLACGITSGK